MMAIRYECKNGSKLVYGFKVIDSKTGRFLFWTNKVTISRLDIPYKIAR